MLTRLLHAALALAVLAGCRSGDHLGTIVIAVPHEVVSLDPHAEDSLANITIHAHLYEALVKVDATLNIVPGLADRWETPDPQTWVFHLRPGVFFHSGAPLRAADVVASFQRLMNGPELQMRAYLTDVEDVRAQGDTSVVVRIRQPSSIVLHRLSRILIVPARHGDLKASADGTGPWSVAEWKPGVAIELKRNERYWNALPALGSVRFELARAPEDALAGLEAGRYQIAHCNSRKAESLTSSKRFRVLRHDSLYVKYLGLNNAVEPFNDPRVRRAIDLAIDRRRLVEGLSNYAVTASQLVPRAVFGFDPALAESRPDLAAARELLRQAGRPQGFRTTLHARRILAETVQLLDKALEPIGIRFDAKVMPDPEFFASMASDQPVPTWLSRYGCLGDSSDILLGMAHSPGASSRFGWNNWQHYSEPAMDQAIEDSSTLKDPRERLTALQAIMGKVVADRFLLPLYVDQDVYVVDRSLNWEPRSDSMILADEITPAR